MFVNTAKTLFLFSFFSLLSACDFGYQEIWISPDSDGARHTTTLLASDTKATCNIKITSGDKGNSMVFQVRKADGSKEVINVMANHTPENALGATLTLPILKQDNQSNSNTPPKLETGNFVCELFLAPTVKTGATPLAQVKFKVN